MILVPTRPVTNLHLLLHQKRNLIAFSLHLFLHQKRVVVRKVLHVLLLYIVRHDVEGLAVLREAEDLNLLLISYHHSLSIELKCLPESLDTSLREAQELVFDVDFGLEERRDWTTLYNFDFDLVRLIVQPDCEGRLVMLVGEQRVHILILDPHLRMLLELKIYVRLGYVLDLELVDV